MDRAVNAESMAATGAPLAVQQGLGTLWEHQGFEVESDWLWPGRYVDASANWTRYRGVSESQGLSVCTAVRGAL